MRWWLGLVACLACRISTASPQPAPNKEVEAAEVALAARDSERALRLFARACAAGDQHACARQGFYLVYDNHDPARVATAVRLWITACDTAGDPLACSNLAGCYSDGEGVPHDDKRSALLFAKACDRDDNFSCGQLALAYSEGTGVEHDLPRAFALADKGCRLKSPSACTILGLGWSRGWNGRSDPLRAVALFRSSCERDDVGGCFQLGFALRAGRGVARDPVQARQYFEKACRRAPDLEGCMQELGPPATR